MEMTKLVLLSLAVYGAANAIAVLKVGHPLRSFLETREVKSQSGFGKAFWGFWRALFKCPPCLSFWIGMAASHWTFSITRGMMPELWLSVVADGFILCATSWLLHLVAERLGHGLVDI